MGDVRHANLDEAPRPEMYVPFAQFPVNSMSVVMRTAVRPQSLIPQIEREVRALDRELPLNDVKTLDERISRLIARPRFNTLLTGLFALLALALAAIGIYGVISYSVAERTHEIGIRMALGAGRMNLLKLILKQGMWLVIAGAALGVVIAALLTRLISSFLYGTSLIDPLVYAGVVSLLLTVALLACLIPARRATRVDPLVALRDE
ncbi:MAG TPA: FtsX-like permease family protein [Pyrinomonadaceae bacterium]|nr:FtsX-like permease family protein [Pyrinomonadaceae bacterium]